MSDTVFGVLLSQPGLAVAVGSLAAFGAALYYLFSRRIAPQVEEEAQDELPEPRYRLRTRPLKPAIDLRIYTYGDQ